jgi:hypothetical protein
MKTIFNHALGFASADAKTVLTSFHSLALPDGRPLTLPSGAQCDSLDRFELAHALVALGVAGVDAGTGIADSLRLYSEHLETIKTAAVKSYSAAVQATQEPKAV